MTIPDTPIAPTPPPSPSSPSPTVDPNPPVTPASTETPAQPVKNIIRLNWLGFFIDGWAELIEGMGGKEESIKAEVKKELDRREMPDVIVEDVDATETFFTLQTRPYKTTTTSPGATTTVYVAKHGPDLYVAWRTHIRPIPNWRLLWIIVQIALGLGLAYGLIFTIIGLFTGIGKGFFASEAAKEFGIGLLRWGFYGLSIFFLVFIFFLILGSTYPYTEKFFKLACSVNLMYIVTVIIGIGIVFILKKNLQIENINRWQKALIYLYPIVVAFIISWIIFMATWVIYGLFRLSRWIFDKKRISAYSAWIGAVSGFILANPPELGNNLSNMWDIFVFHFLSGVASFGLLPRIAISVFIGAVILLMVGGLLFHKNPIYYLIKQPTEFDIEDITAMGLAVHKSLLRVLDQQGIDVEKLRIKTRFKGGRKDEDV